MECRGRRIPDVRHPNKVERWSDIIPDVRHPGGMSERRIPDVRHPDKVERWPDRIPDVRHPGGMSADKNSGCETSGLGRTWL